MVFYVLLLSFILTSSLFLLDYKQGQLQELKTQLPPELNEIIDKAAKMAGNLSDKIMEFNTQMLVKIEELSSRVPVGDKTLADILFSGKAKAKQEAEQKRMVEEAKKKKLAEEAEKKKLAEEAEKKKLAEEAEKKKLAEEAEKKKLAEEAEKKKLAEEVEKKKLAEEAEKKKLAEEAEKKKKLAEGEAKQKV